MAEMIYLADRRGHEPHIEQFRQQIAEWKAFHDEFELNMRLAFQVVKARNPGAMDHLSCEELEYWFAGRIKKRSRMRAARRLRQSIDPGTITAQSAAHISIPCASVACRRLGRGYSRLGGPAIDGKFDFACPKPCESLRGRGLDQGFRDAVHGQRAA